MATKNEKKTFYAQRDFKDAGTTRFFERGATVDADEGDLANYAAAGLVSTEKPKSPAEAEAAALTETLG